MRQLRVHWLDQDDILREACTCEILRFVWSHWPAWFWHLRKVNSSVVNINRIVWKILEESIVRWTAHHFRSFWFARLPPTHLQRLKLPNSEVFPCVWSSHTASASYSTMNMNEAENYTPTVDSSRVNLIFLLDFVCISTDSSFTIGFVLIFDFDETSRCNESMQETKNQWST